MKPSATLLLIAVLLIIGLPGRDARSQQLPRSDASKRLILWYNEPAKLSGKPPAQTAMNETLPVGNGRIGALIFGETARERLVLNDVSLWTGNEQEEGAYQALADVFINLPGHEKVSAYRRELDLPDGIARTSYQLNGGTFSREYFSSYPSQLIVVRFTASRPGGYSGSIELDDKHGAKTLGIAGKELSAAGALNNGLNYETRIKLLAEGGTQQTDGNKLVFSGCNSLTLLIAAGTDYSFDYAKGYRGAAPAAKLEDQLAAASGKSYPELRRAHTTDFKSLFGRVGLSLGTSSGQQRALPTGLRKAAAALQFDPEMETLLFQYGRYLLISSSRTGGIAANLQGIWNDSNNPPWGSDYHDNINVEMNYWPSEPANLAECSLPFFNLIRSQLVPWRKATVAAPEINTVSGAPAARGFALRTSHNIYGHTDWKWDKTANAWYCQQLWEHYAFGLDKNYLRTVAYPIMKEVAEFWEDHLKPLPDGRLVVPDGWSPEHGPTEDGVSYNQQIVWDLFNNYAEAAAELGIDLAYGRKIAALRDRLVGPKVGRWGQLQEWMDDKDDPDDHHRHTSNLFAVFPGRQVSVARTPALAKAAKVSVDARGPTGDVREWSYAWRTALYARLHEGEQAHAMLKQFFTDKNSCLNLFGLHPPMQMDGNFGMTAAIAELLIQSHEGEINLLPALPAEWKDGSVSGLRARGGFTLDLVWKNSRLVKAVVHNVNGTRCTLRYREKTNTLTALRKGAQTTVLF